MNSRDRIVIEKIKSHAESIVEYCAGCESLEAFDSNSMLVEATVFNLMQIGELAKTTLSDEAKEEITSIPWKQLYGMRNRIVHGYDGINMQIVWDTVCEDIPALIKELKMI